MKSPDSTLALSEYADPSTRIESRDPGMVCRLTVALHAVVASRFAKYAYAAILVESGDAGVVCILAIALNAVVASRLAKYAMPEEDVP
jgi:hypothetical protein